MHAKITIAISATLLLIPALLGAGMQALFGSTVSTGVHEGENSAGAAGPMQFLAPTFHGVLAAHRIPPGGATPPSRYNPHDAIHAAAFLLCDEGVSRGDLRAGIFAYNHADWYVDLILDQAAEYAEAAVTSVGNGDCNAIQAPNTITLTAINYACGMRGLPCVWGGDGPDAGHTGFDCSGLTKAAYAAGITLPRTAQTQFDTGPRVPAGQPLLPATWSSTAHPATSTTSASTSAQAA